MIFVVYLYYFSSKSMKNTTLLLVLAVLFGFLPSAHAQTANTPAAPDTWKDVKLGLMFMPGVSSNAGSVANGTKTNAINFSWALGAMADFPFSPNSGLQLGLCYDNRSVQFHDQTNGDTSIAYTFSYFSLRPEFRIGGFTVGLGIGIPVGASTTASAAATNMNKTQTFGSSNMNILLEGRIGATIPVVQAANGNELRFLISGSYAFSQIVSSPLLPSDNSQNKTDNSGPLATLQLGFAYLFDLNPR
jgi:hypothetical protein